MVSMLACRYGLSVTTARRTACLLVLLMLLASCSGERAPTPPSGTVRVVASAALADALAVLVHDFETRQPGVRVELTTDADTALPGRAGAADIVAFQGTIPAIHVAEGSVPLARGQLVLAIPADNPLVLSSLADLARPEVRVALCAATEPCGATTAAVLTAAGATVTTPVVRPTVRAALADLLAGTADAALVYRSDVRHHDDVATLEFPESSAVLATFSVARSATAANQGMADLLLAFLTSPAADDTLTAAGFLPPA
jgi:molybdate transport system substrate-binding protein